MDIKKSRVLKELSRVFSKSDWKPKQGLVYKSWFKGDSHFGKNAVVKIIYAGKEYEDGTFRVNGEKCELRIGEGKWIYGPQCGKVKLFNVRRLITQTENISFKKKVKNIDTIWGGPRLGQNGYAGTEILYVAEILNPKNVEENSYELVN